MSFELKDLKNFEQVFPTKMCTSIYSFSIALFFYFFFSDFFHVKLLNKSFEYNTCYFHCTMQLHRLFNTAGHVSQLAGSQEVNQILLPFRSTIKFTMIKVGLSVCGWIICLSQHLLITVYSGYIYSLPVTKGASHWQSSITKFGTLLQLVLICTKLYFHVMFTENIL